MSYPGTGVQNINLTSQPDYATQLAQIQRRQALAQALQQQADASIDVQSSNGIQAPIPATAILAKVLQRIGSSMQANRATKAQGDLTAKEKQDAQNTLSYFLPKPVGSGAVAAQDTGGGEGVAVTGRQMDTSATFAQKQAMMPQAMMQAASNPYLAPALSMIQQQMKPDIRAIGPEGLARVNPDGTVDQVADGKPAAPVKQSLEEKFVGDYMGSHPKGTMADAEHAWAVARHVSDPNSGYGSTLNLTPEQNIALNKGIQEGKIDAGKVNSRTAKILADLYMNDPTVNQVDSAGHAAMVRNASLQQKIQVAETLPAVLENIRAAGKKLNYSDVAIIGKMQGWAKGQVNDPDVVSYMTQRNDGLMSIASVMRGVGMSDKATELEEQVSNPTMSPRAIDAYVNAQMMSLKPRLEKYRKLELGGGSQPAATQGSAKTVVRTGTDKSGKKVVQYSDGTVGYASP